MGDHKDHEDHKEHEDHEEHENHEEHEEHKGFSLTRAGWRARAAAATISWSEEGSFVSSFVPSVLFVVHSVVQRFVVNSVTVLCG